MCVRVSAYAINGLNLEGVQLTFVYKACAEVDYASLCAW